MSESIYSAEYAVVIAMLRGARVGAGVTQRTIADRLSRSQSYVSKCERGERRLDVVELRAFCVALDVSFPDFVETLDRTLSAKPEPSV